MEFYVLSSLVEVICCDVTQFTQLMGSCFVVGLLFFGVYGTLFNVLIRRVALYFVGDR